MYRQPEHLPRAPAFVCESAAGLNHAFTGQWRPIHDFTHADVMVSFDCDFLGQHPEELTLSKQPPWTIEIELPLDGVGMPNHMFLLAAHPSRTLSTCD